MSKRRGWKRGDWLVRDEGSGFIEYGSNVVRDYYGVLRRKDQADEQHPQDFVQAKQEDFVQYPQSDPSLTYNVSAYNVSAYVYGTTIPSPYGPAAHLFFQPTVNPVNDPAIPNMAIGDSFIIR